MHMEGMSKQIKLMMMHARTTARFTHVLPSRRTGRFILCARLQACNNEQTHTGMRIHRLSAQLATMAAATVYGTHVSYGVLMSVRAFIPVRAPPGVGPSWLGALAGRQANLPVLVQGTVGDAAAVSRPEQAAELGKSKQS